MRSLEERFLILVFLFSGGISCFCVILMESKRGKECIFVDCYGFDVKG